MVVYLSNPLSHRLASGKLKSFFRNSFDEWQGIYAIREIIERLRFLLLLK